MPKRQGRKIRKKVNKRNWPPAIIPLIKTSKSAHHEHKTNPSDENEKKAKAARKQLRSMQRQICAIRRNEHLENIMVACERNQAAFFSLVKQQRSETNNAIKIEFNPEPSSQLEGWRAYFQELATPQQQPHYDDSYKEALELRLLLIESLEAENEERVEIGIDDVEKYIASLKNNKAADAYGITSEHLKHADPILTEILVESLQQTYDNRIIPNQLKLGILTPVVKKGKSQHCPDSYRRITVNPISGKLVEKQMMKDSRPQIAEAQNRHQRGFSEKASSTNAALLITESIAEAKDLHNPIFIQFLDARKAFDLVWHTGLLCTLYEQGITGPTWQMYNSLYTGIQSSVKWNGQLSESFYDEHGLRQGGDTSGDTFKMRTNPMLNKQEESPDAFHIGATTVGAPTCADDTALISPTLTGAKMMLQIAHQDSCNQRYIFSSTKSKIMIVNPNQKAKQQLESFPVNLANKTIEESTEETHLGIQRVPSDKATPTIEARIKTARRAMFAMMGAGLHGLNGLNPIYSKKLLDIYIIPRLTHSLEAMKISDSETKKLECVYRTKLKQVQHLPKNTASPAVYLLVGALPAEGILDMKVLSFFNRIALQHGSLEYEIIGRQLALKDQNSNSWTITVRKTLEKYNLPSAFTLFKNPKKKSQWKTIVKNAVVAYWDETLKKEASTKSTLKYLNTQACSVMKPHPCYLTTPTDPLKVTMTAVKAKLMVQRYPLTASHASGKHKQDLCPICHVAPETLHHFLFRCKPIGQQRGQYTSHIQNILSERKLIVPPLVSSSLDWYTQLILDPSMLTEDLEVILKIEDVSRQMVYNLHHKRAVALGGGSKYVKGRYVGNILKMS